MSTERHLRLVHTQDDNDVINDVLEELNKAKLRHPASQRKTQIQQEDSQTFDGGGK